MWPAGGRAVAQAIGVGTKVGAALDDFPRHARLRLSPVVALLDSAAPRIAGDAAGLVHLGRVAVDVPVGGPVPDVARHVVEAVRVRRKRANRRGRAVSDIRSPREVTMPEIGELIASNLTDEQEAKLREVFTEE